MHWSDNQFQALHRWIYLENDFFNKTHLYVYIRCGIIDNFRQNGIRLPYPTVTIRDNDYSWVHLYDALVQYLNHKLT